MLFSWSSDSWQRLLQLYWDCPGMQIVCSVSTHSAYGRVVSWKSYNKFMNWRIVMIEINYWHTLIPETARTPTLPSAKANPRSSSGNSLSISGTLSCQVDGLGDLRAVKTPVCVPSWIQSTAENGRSSNLIRWILKPFATCIQFTIALHVLSTVMPLCLELNNTCLSPVQYSNLNKECSMRDGCVGHSWSAFEGEKQYWCKYLLRIVILKTTASSDESHHSMSFQNRSESCESQSQITLSAWKPLLKIDKYAVRLELEWYN